MSLEAFQRALCDLVASPALARTLRADPEWVLGRYELTPREQRRLRTIAGQRGMATSCSLYRVNRITPVYTLLPFTCFVLGDDLGREAELFWESYAETDLQFKREIDCFADFLRRRLHAGHLANPFLEEVLRFELATNVLRFLPRREIARGLSEAGSSPDDLPLWLHPLLRVVSFRHDPGELLHYLAQMLRPPSDLARGEYFLLLDARGVELEVKKIDPCLGRLLQAIAIGPVSSLAPEDAEALVQAGLLVRANLDVAMADR